jgi:WD40 repeat protein
MNSNTSPQQMVYASFNQDASCFVLGNEKGFKVFGSFNFGKDFHERIIDGGVSIIELYYRSNFIAFVGKGAHSQYPNTKVILWDDFNTKIISEFKFTSTIKSLKLKKDKILIVCETKIFLFSLLNYNNLLQIDTDINKRGLIAINLDPLITVIAYLTNTNSAIKIHHLETGKDITITLSYDNCTISCFALNYDGSLLAIASDNGTNIQIYRTIDGMYLQQFKRSKEKSEITYICFDMNCKLMAASSDKGTIHIWHMDNCITKSKETPITDEIIHHNKTNILSSIGGYFKSEWNFAQVKLDEQHSSICAFGPDNTLIAITSVGKYYQAQIDMKRGGNCKIINEYSNLL